MMTSVDGIFACGNVLHVHDLVDFVTNESEKADVPPRPISPRKRAAPQRRLRHRSTF
jgi:hypothetical protein